MTIPFDPYAGMGIIFISIIGVLILSCVISIAIAVWVYKDAKKRGMEATMWLAIVLLGGCIGCIIYLIVRDPIVSDTAEKQPYGYPSTFPSQENSIAQSDYYKKGEKDTKYCRNCGERIPFDATFCPFCGTQQ